MNIAIIGAGGTGGWVATCLAKMLSEQDRLLLVDKDKFEEHNMDRQLGCRVGAYKVNALARTLSTSRCAIDTKTEWFKESTDLGDTDTILCAVDNHPARIACLKWCEQEADRLVVIAGNEYWDAEAYVYRRPWREGPLDPRSYYPELLESTEGDPLHPPCTGEVLESEPQLALANNLAAAFAVQLLWHWRIKAAQFDLSDQEIMDSMPVQMEVKGGIARTRQVKHIATPS